MSDYQFAKTQKPTHIENDDYTPSKEPQTDNESGVSNRIWLAAADAAIGF